MPNIIINNYCNQACSYCFANDNMQDESLQKNMKLSTYLSILQYLKKIGDNNVRILWGEPIIFPDLRRFLDIAEKWGFQIIVFSNINIPVQKFEKIFSWLTNVRINCNINDESFYSDTEKENIHKNLSFLQTNGFHTILWYNITDISLEPHMHISLARKYGIKNLNLKVTNSSLWWELLIDTWSREFWDYLYNFIKKYSPEFVIELSCWVSPSIFTPEQLSYIQDIAKITIYFWCEGHRWKFDINTDGSIFKCYPLESLYKKDKIYIQSLLQDNIPLESTLDTLYSWVYSDWECTAHKVIKWEISLW